MKRENAPNIWNDQCIPKTKLSCLLKLKEMNMKGVLCLRGRVD